MPHVPGYERLVESSSKMQTKKSVACSCNLLNKNNFFIIAQGKCETIIEKSIVCTCDFFNNNSSCKCNSFSPMLTRKTYFISLGTKLSS